MQLITILGQTSSGKSDMAIELANTLKIRFEQRCCVVNCDSRQVYRGLNIGTGKVQGSWIWEENLNREVFECNGILHFLIDFVDPASDYNLGDYVRDFGDLMKELDGNFDTVILTGGTGLYAQTILQKIDLGKVKDEFISNYNDRKTHLKTHSKGKLQNLITKYKIELNNSDLNNPIRLVSNILRYEAQESEWLEENYYYNFQRQPLFAIKIDQDILKSKIKTRLESRFDSGLLQEIKDFEQLGADKFHALGLEYRQGWLYLNDKISKEELESNLLQENLQYAKRQLTWLKKMKSLVWVEGVEEVVGGL
jgi:tRNA dimethylallyltransferase